MSVLRTHFHVPTPGGLMSPISGSAIVTVAPAMGVAHFASEGSEAFVARAGLDHDPRPLGTAASLYNALVCSTPVVVRSRFIADLLTGDGELAARAAAAQARAEEISRDRQPARLTEWLGQWEAA